MMSCEEHALVLIGCAMHRVMQPRAAGNGAIGSRRGRWGAAFSHACSIAAPRFLMHESVLGHGKEGSDEAAAQCPFNMSPELLLADHQAPALPSPSPSPSPSL